MSFLCDNIIDGYWDQGWLRSDLSLVMFVPLSLQDNDELSSLLQPQQDTKICISSLSEPGKTRYGQCLTQLEAEEKSLRIDFSKLSECYKSAPENIAPKVKKAEEAPFLEARDRDFRDFLLAHLDYQDGITTIAVDDPEKKHFPTGRGYIRNACDSKILDKREDSTHPMIQLDNMLLRCHSIKYAIGHTLTYYINNDDARQALFENTDSKQIYEGALRTLHDEFHVLLVRVNKIHTNATSPEEKKEALSKIQAEEYQFNKAMIHCLHRCGLDVGVDYYQAKDDYSDVLLHYRNLSAVLDVAHSQVTLTAHKEKGLQLFHIQQADPITTKTATQIKNLSRLSNPLTDLLTDLPFNTEQMPAKRFATAAYAQALVSPLTRLGDQARYTFPDSVKNAYLNTTRQCFLNKAGKVETAVSVDRSLRFACLTFLGNGYNKKENLINRQSIAKENLAQIQAWLESRGLNQTIHLTLLNTDSPHNRQNIIVADTKKAFSDAEQACTYMPVNSEGVTRQVNMDDSFKKTLSTNLKDNKSIIEHDKHSLPSWVGYMGRALSFLPMAIPAAIQALSNQVKKTRIRFGGWLAYVAGKTTTHISAIACASGRDRTGTISEIKEIFDIMHFYNNNQEHEGVIDFATAACIHARGAHNTKIATLACPGSEGIKKDSYVSGLFPKQVDKVFYRKAAKTNKSVPLKHCDALIVRGNVTQINVQARVVAMLNRYLKMRSGFCHSLGFHSWRLTEERIASAKKAKTKIAKLSHKRESTENINDIIKTLQALKETLEQQTQNQRTRFGHGHTSHGSLHAMVVSQLATAEHLKKQCQDNKTPHKKPPKKASSPPPRTR